MAALRRPIDVALKDGRRVTLRAAQPRHAAAVVRLLDDVAAEPGHPLLHLPGSLPAARLRRRFSRAAGDERALDLVAEDQGLVCAILETRPAGAAPALAHVCELGLIVAASHRGQGLGTALIETCAEWAAAHGFVKATLSVFAGNVAAQAFYERRGFVREGLRRAQLRRGGEYHDEVLMARFLTTVS